MRASGLVLLFGLLIPSTLTVCLAGEFQTVQLRGDKTDDYSGVVFGPVEQKDTLWKIAKDYRNSPDFVGQRPNSLYPVMYGIYLLNPQAFKDNNVNHLLNDTMLEMPTAAFMAKIDPLEAEAKIEGDETLWAELQALKNAVVFANTSTPEESEQSSTANEPQTTPVSILDDKPTETITLPNAPTSQLTTQQLQVLNELKSQYAISLETIQVLLNENERLADQLQNVAERVDALSGQVNGDLQAQIDALGAIQAQIYETIQQENAKQGPSTLEQAAEILAKPFVLIALISLLVLLALVGLGLWLFRRNSPKESDELETLGEVDDEPLSELDEIFDSSAEQDVPDIVSTEELARDLDEVPEVIEAVPTESNEFPIEEEVDFGDELIVPDNDSDALVDDLVEDTELLSDIELVDDEERKLRDAIEENDFEEGDATLAQDDLDALFADAVGEPASSEPDDTDQEELDTDTQLDDEPTPLAEEDVLSEVTDLEQSLGEIEAFDSITEEDDIAALPDDIEIADDALLDDDDLDKISTEAQHKAAKIDSDMDTLMSELEQIEMMESMLGDDIDDEPIADDVELSDAVELFEEPSAEEPSAEEPSAEEPSAEEPSAEEPSAEEPTVPEDKSMEVSVSKSPADELDDLLELPDLDGWLNGDSDKEVLDELENSDFDDILSSLEANDVTELDESDVANNRQKEDAEPAKDEFDDLKFNVETPDFIDVDALLNELDDEPMQSEPELDILQNIADKLPAQSDVEVQDSDAMGKLDLARAYIEIDEFSDAKALLNEVIKLGTATESAEAKQLLQQLKEL